ncbi:MAG: hypothetical protein JWP09_784 [Candidatus Taylorbacteria bacterium]|nr:hypothetical protein [Candidatus Taylorbacteria bacterium]
MIWSKEKQEGVRGAFYNFLYIATIVITVFYFGPDVHTREREKLVIFVIYVFCLEILGKIRISYYSLSTKIIGLPKVSISYVRSPMYASIPVTSSVSPVLRS